MKLENQLKISIQEALLTLFDVQETATIQATKKEFEGTYTYVTFPLVKALRKNPVEIGNAIGNYLFEKTSLVHKFNVVQGFLNLSIPDAVWIDTLNDIVADKNYGIFPKNGQSVMVEFSSPNTNKPLHLGHLRNNFYGFSISEILEANGYDVVRICLVNDRGIHICKSMIAYEKFGNHETPESSGLKGDHLAGKYYVIFDKEYKKQIAELMAKGQSEEEAKKNAPLMLETQEMLQKWEQSDAETLALWHKMNDWVYQGFDETYKNIGVSFDKTYYDSDTYLLGKEVVQEGLAKGIFFKKENGSVWIDLKEEGLDEKLVLRADGTSVYITQDLGTTDMKFKDYDVSKSIWVVGDEQNYHFQVLFAILKKLGRSYINECYHLSYGHVDLPSGRMKSREGTIVDGDDLVAVVKQEAQKIAEERSEIMSFPKDEQQKLFEMVGVGALKYFLLKVDPKSRMLFNPEESVKLQGNTAPYIQYTHARMCSILRKAEQNGISISEALKPSQIEKIESELIYLLSQYPTTVAMAGHEYSPAVICQYAYDLAKTFNQFYAEVSILNEPDAEKLKFRIAIVKALSETILKAMLLLGIEVPQRM